MIINVVCLALASAILAAEKPAPPASAGACPVGPDNACVLDLKGKERPTVPAVCTADPWPTYLAFQQPERLSDSNGDAWWESVVRIRLDPTKGCDCAVFVASYEKEPSGFTVDIGDSPTNDGFGGDAGTTALAAEAHVTGSGLSVFTQFPVDEVLHVSFPSLAGRTVTLRVCDQQLAFELDKAPGEARPLSGVARTLLLPRLFALGGQASPDKSRPSREADYDLFAAFNRVIHVMSGAPAKERTGTGLRRVEIYLTP